MEQNRQYLYEYQNGERVRNIGFMKIEQQMDRCVIQIYAKNMNDVKGIVFQKDDGERYVGCWEPELYTINERQETAPTPQMVEAEVRKPTIIEEGAEVNNKMDTENAMEAEHEIDEYIPPSNITYEKIERKDLSRLPRKEWRLANNSFLLHGFYNYHHLLYIEDEGKIWIGVPGIYHEKERMAANAFGFTEFRRLTDADINLEENEKNTYEDFGYWCRQIPIS